MRHPHATGNKNLAHAGEVTGFLEKHVPDLVKSLESLSVIDPLYPPRAVVENGDTAKWLMQYTGMYRAVIIVNGQAVGHVQIVPGLGNDGNKILRNVGMDKYFAENTEVSKMFEIARLFVGREHHGKGLGKLLLESAVKHLLKAGLIPVLCVEETQTHAIDLYGKSGWHLCGTFENKMAKNILIYSYGKTYPGKTFTGRGLTN